MNRRLKTQDIDVSQFRSGLRDALDQVVQSGRRLTISRHGRKMAALVPLGDLQALEEREEDLAHDLVPRSGQRSVTEVAIEDAIEDLASSDNMQIAHPAPSQAEAKLGAQLDDVKVLVEEFDASNVAASIQRLHDAMERIVQVMDVTERRQEAMEIKVKKIALSQALELRPEQAEKALAAALTTVR